MRVLLIDPWGTNNTAEYLNGLIYGFSDLVDLTVYTNFFFEQYIYSSADVNRVFFSKSETMKQGKIRTAIRGFEYIRGYLKILSTLKQQKYDIVHVNWLLNYTSDIRFLKRIKKNHVKLVYTAHNVLPHVNGGKAIGEMRIIYDIVDKIIVHGETVKEELIKNFPDTKNKVYVQKHGCVIKKPADVPETEEVSSLIEKIKCFGKVFVSCGAVFYNKGFDRLINIWLENYTKENAVLIVGGRQMESYYEYEKCKELIKNKENIILMDGFIKDDVMNALFQYSDVIVLPYRHASMSGVVFSAAQYGKPVVCTRVGALPEYLEDKIDSFICNNTDTDIKNALDMVIDMDKEELNEMGKKLKYNIRTKCDWKVICSGLLNNVYQKRNTI